MYSIIIPTLNEEKYLPSLLESLNRIPREDFEVIVADAFSKDKTREIAEKMGAKVVDGGAISVGRNAGAKAAKYDIFIFLDSDVTVEPDFLDKIDRGFIKKKLDLSSAYLYKDTGRLVTNFAYHMWDFSKTVRQFTKAPDGTGQCTIVKREAFERVGGYDVMKRIGNDSDFIVRCAKAGARFRMTKVSIHASTRRYERVGVLRVMIGNFIAGIVSRNNQKAQTIAQIIYGGWGQHNNVVPANEKNVFAITQTVLNKLHELDKNVLVFGGTGFLGEGIVDELIANGFNPILYVRDEKKMEKRWEGHVSFYKGELFDPEAIRRAIQNYKPTTIIYAAGIIKENKTTSFNDVHYHWPRVIVELAERAEIERFIYISANGAREDGTNYQRTKWKFENYLANETKTRFTIFQPSIIEDDSEKYSFRKQVESLLKYRIIPMIGKGKYKIAPITRDLVARSIVESIHNKKTYKQTEKLVGEKVYTFKDYVKKMAKEKNKKILIIPMPVFFYRIVSKLFRKVTPITNDQITMLVEGNV